MTIGMPICTQTFTRNIVLLGSGPAEVGTPASSHKDVRRTHWGSNTYWSENSTVASALRTAAVWRMAARVSAAQAWLDVPDFGRARALGEQVRASARQLRHAAFEARATWVGRAARYRSGEDLKADPAWVDAAEEVDDAMFAVMAINEAAIAWRAGDGLAGSLARRALAAFGRRTNADGVLLARALLRGLEGGDHPGDEALAAEAMRATVPEVGLQALALIPHPEPGRWRARGIELAASRPAEAWSVCLDVMSIDEALERLGS